MLLAAASLHTITTTIEMVPWDSASTSPTLCHSCRQALSNFLRAFQKNDPWWFSLLHPVGSDKDTCLSHLLSLDHSVAVEFFCCTGLTKVGHSRNARATVALKAEWEKFVIEENLCNLIKGVNQTSISGMKHFFINISGKDRLRHRATW
jgi:hypothetical protein